MQYLDNSFGEWLSEDFKKFWSFVSMPRCSVSTTACDICLSSPLIASRGRSTKTESQLKQWTVAPANALD